MANEPLAWLLTYALHSTLFLGAAWLLSIVLPDRARVVRETTWKAALLGAFLTASFQVMHSEPIADASHESIPATSHEWTTASNTSSTAAPNGGLTIRLGPPTNESNPDRPQGGVQAESAQTERSGIEVSALRDLAAKKTLRSAIAPIAVRSELMTAVGAVSVLLALFGASRILRAHLALRRRTRDRRELTDGSIHRVLARLRRRASIRREIRLTESDAIAGPIAIGLSEICVPSRALDLPEEELEALLAHELGHLARRDPLWANLAFAIENIFFFQPLNRLARRRIQQEAEYLADDWAIEQTGSGFNLARCLATVAGWVAGTPELRAASAMAGSHSPLVGRVERLLDADPKKPGRLVRWMRMPLCGALLLTVAMLAPEVTAKVAGPRGTGIAPLPHRAIAQLDEIQRLDRYTIRVEDDEDGVVEARVEDGDVVGVRLDGETVPDDRYSVDDGILVIENESGDLIAEVDIDLRSRITRRGGWAVAPVHIGAHSWSDEEVDEAVRRSLEAARIEMYDLRHRMDDLDEWEVDATTEAELREGIEESFEEAQAEVEEEIDTLREDLEGLRESQDLDARELEELEEEIEYLERDRDRLLEELDREKVRALRRLERGIDRLREHTERSDGGEAGGSTHGRVTGPWIVGRAGSGVAVHRYHLEVERGRREIERTRTELEQRLREERSERRNRDRSERMGVLVTPVPPEVHAYAFEYNDDDVTVAPLAPEVHAYAFEYSDDDVTIAPLPEVEIGGPVYVLPDPVAAPHPPAVVSARPRVPAPSAPDRP